MPAGLPGYLRIRVVNPKVSTIWSEGFENPLSANASLTNLWHSIGTEAGTDNSLNYWSVSSGGAWSFASHIATPPATTNDANIQGGHPDWSSYLVEVRVAAAKPGAGIMAFVSGTGDGYMFQFDATNAVRLYKRVGGVYTGLAAAQSFTYTTGNPAWLILNVTVAGQITYAAALDSAGAPGSYTSFGPVSDSTFTSGQCGLHANTNASAGITFGGAFNFVCHAYVLPSGLAPNFWTPVVNAGEPAFALSKVAPPAGTYSASIYLGSSAGNGSWQQTTTLPATAPTTQTLLQGQAKAATGTANISAGGLTTPNASSTFSNLTATGQMTANPTVSCNYSGALGAAYFDSLSIVSQGTEITSDLPHPHQSRFDVRAIQPGNPGNSAYGTWTVPLFPPGSTQYAAAKAVYDGLDYGQRLEGYLTYDATAGTLGKLKCAGIIRGIRKQRGASPFYALAVESDTVLANLSRPHPGELLSNVTTDNQLKSYLGTNELGFGDDFSIFTATNYTSTFLPGGSAGTWSSATDDGDKVAACSSGTAAVLISKTGGAANDRWHTQYVEVTGRLTPSADATNAGEMGVGFTQANSNGNNAVLAFVAAQKVSGRYQLQAGIQVYAGGAVLKSQVVNNVLSNVDDPAGNIGLEIGLLLTTGGNSAGTPTATLIVNGRVVLGQYPTSYDPGTAPQYPFLEFAAPATGSATANFANFVQLTRFTTDGPSTAAVFGNGSITGSSNSLAFGNDPGPGFLEIWSRLATREGWYWRYTPQPYVVGTRTLGTVDFGASPGTDRSSQVFFNGPGGAGAPNLFDLALTANSDRYAVDTAISGQPTLDGGGIAHSRNVAAIISRGVIQDETLGWTHSDFNMLRVDVFRIVQNKVSLGPAGAKIAQALRDAETADKWRELDSVTIDDPEMGFVKAKALVLGYDFIEGTGAQSLYLDQYSEDI